jgi:hypothetical protein
MPACNLGNHMTVCRTTGTTKSHRGVVLPTMASRKLYIYILLTINSATENKTILFKLTRRLSTNCNAAFAASALPAISHYQPKGALQVLMLA